MKEYSEPRPHKRFRIRGALANTGSHLDVAMTPDGTAYCLDVFLNDAPVVITVDASTDDGASTFPIQLCAACKRVMGVTKN